MSVRSPLEQIDPQVRSLDEQGRIAAIQRLPKIPEPADPDNAGFFSIDSRELATNFVVKNRAAMLYSLFGYQANAAARFVLVFDDVSLPANGAVPKLVIPVAAGPIAWSAVGIPVRGLEFLRGIVVALSSTGPILTLAGADLWVNAAVDP